MAEPPASWEQPDDDNSTASSTALKLGRLNVNASEFVPSFGGSGFSLAPIVPQPTVPKTPPSTPVVTRNITEEEETKQTEPVMIKASEVNIQQQVKEPITTVGEREFDDFLDEDNESEFNFFFKFLVCR